MIHSVLAVALGLSCAAAVPIPENDQAPRVHVEHVLVHFSLPEGAGKGIGGHKTDYASVGFQVRIPHRQIIGVDVKKSALRALTDKETNLQKNRNSAWLSPVLQPALDGAARFAVQSDRLPAADAEKICIDAEVVLLCGRGNLINVKTLKLEELGVKKVGKNFVEIRTTDLGTEVVLHSPVGFVKAVEVKDQRGKVLPMHGPIRLTVGTRDIRVFSTFSERSEMTIRIESFAAVEPVTIPVRVDVGLAGATDYRP